MKCNTLGISPVQAGKRCSWEVLWLRYRSSVESMPLFWSNLVKMMLLFPFRDYYSTAKECSETYKNWGDLESRLEYKREHQSLTEVFLLFLEVLIFILFSVRDGYDRSLSIPEHYMRSPTPWSFLIT